MRRSARVAMLLARELLRSRAPLRRELLRLCVCHDAAACVPPKDAACVPHIHGMHMR